MTLNKYLPNNVGIGTATPKTKFAQYTFNTDFLPTHYYFTDQAWSNDISLDYTDCKYLYLK